MSKIDVTSDQLVRNELIGLEMLLCPFAQHISSQRGSMFASNIVQSLVVNGAEPPKIQTGYESIIGKYDINKTDRKHDIQVIEVIPRFRTHVGAGQIRSNPSVTVIYRDCDTNEVSYFDREQFTALYDGFGCENKLYNNGLLRPGSFIAKETLLSTAPNVDGPFYSMGTNANVMFGAFYGVCDDAFIISESLQKKTEHYAVNKVKISFKDETHIPLNLYGTADEYKIMPDIGEPVNSNGIIIGVRELHDDTFIADTLDLALSQPEFMNDDLYVAEEGVTVLDVQVYCSSKAFRQLSIQPGAYDQLIKYQKQHYDYYNAIVRVYNDCLSKNMKISTHFNSFVTDTMQLQFNKFDNDERRNVRLVDKRDNIDFITIEITYGGTRKIGKGFKFSGRDGAKGVVSDVWPDDRMPIDEEGIRADIIISPESVFNRMNPSQMYEQFLGRALTLIEGRLKRNELGNVNQAFDYIMDFCTDVREVYGNYLKSMIRTQDEKEAFIHDVLDKGIFLIIPPFCKDISPENVLFISEKYEIYESRVTYKSDISGTMKSITTRVPIMIGPKYIMLLGKIPLSMMSVVQYGHVNQFGTPAKPGDKSVKDQNLFGRTPIRYGEDEQCMLAMTLGPEVVTRFVGMTANSPRIIDKLADYLVTATKPTCIDRIPVTDEEITRSNINIQIFSHAMGAIGYDVKPDPV